MIDYNKRCEEILNRVVEKRPDYLKEELSIKYHSEGARGIIYEVCCREILIAHGPYKSLMKYKFLQTERKKKPFSIEDELKDILRNKNLEYIGPLTPYTRKHPGLNTYEKFLYRDKNGFIFETTYLNQKPDFKFHNTRLNIQYNIDNLTEYAKDRNLEIENVDLNKRIVTFKCNICRKSFNVPFNLKELFNKKRLCNCRYENVYNSNIGRTPYSKWTKEKAIDLVNSKFKGQFISFEIQNPEKKSRLTFVFTLLNGDKTNPVSVHELCKKDYTTLKTSNKRYEDETYEKYVERRLKEENATFGGIIDDSDMFLSNTLFWYTDKNGIQRVARSVQYNKTLNKSTIYAPVAAEILSDIWRERFEVISYDKHTITRRCLFCGLETKQTFSNAFNQKCKCVCRTSTLDEFKNKIKHLPYIFPDIDDEYKSKDSIISGICNNYSDGIGYFHISVSDVFKTIKVCENCSLFNTCKLVKFSHYNHENYIAHTLKTNNINFKMRDRSVLNGKEIDFVFEINNKKYALEHQGIQHFKTIEKFGSFEKRHNNDLNKIKELIQKGYILLFTKGSDVKDDDFCGYPLKTIHNFLDNIIDNPIYPETPSIKEIENIRLEHKDDIKHTIKNSKRWKAKIKRQKKEENEKEEIEKFNDAVSDSFYLSGVLKAKHPEMYNLWRTKKRTKKYKQISDTIIMTGNDAFYLISDLNHNPIFTIVGESEIEKYLHRSYSSLFYALKNGTPVMLSRNIIEPLFYIKKINPKEMTEFLRDERRLNDIFEQALNGLRICKYNRDGKCVHIYSDKDEYLKEENLENDVGSRYLRNGTEHNEHRFKLFKDTNGEAIDSYYPFKHQIEMRKSIVAYDYESGEIKFNFEYSKEADDFLELYEGSSSAACKREYEYTNTKYGKLVLRYKDE